jgi:pilus assembly protein CpaE
LARLDALAEVSEPGTGVVAIGDTNDIRIYRQIRDAGVAEYYFKPLVGNLVTRTLNTILNGGTEQRGTRTGKLVFVLGVRGGDGATTIAVNTAWHLAETGQRRVLLVDLDLQLGDAALQLDATPSHALREALQHPERVDELFLQRGVTQVTERLGLLASQEGLNEGISLDDEAVLSLLQTFLHRYRYVIVDVPSVLAPRLMRVLTMPSILLLVSSAGLAAARDVARWRQQIGPNTPDRGTLHLLNKNGAAASLPLPEFTRAVGQAPDLIIAYDREVAAATNLGIAAVNKCAGFQRGLTPLYRHLTGEAAEAPQSFLKRIFG